MQHADRVTLIDPQSDSFSERTRADMEVALERGCKILKDGESHEARKAVASAIVELARAGETSLEAFTKVALQAAKRLTGSSALH